MGYGRRQLSFVLTCLEPALFQKSADFVEQRKAPGTYENRPRHPSKFDRRHNHCKHCKACAPYSKPGSPKPTDPLGNPFKTKGSATNSCKNTNHCRPAQLLCQPRHCSAPYPSRQHASISHARARPWPQPTFVERIASFHKPRGIKNRSKKLGALLSDIVMKSDMPFPVNCV